MTKAEPTSYRPCAGIMLVSRQGLAFVGRRIDNKEGDWWQMPQGGIDKGEDPEAAAIRELGEETGLKPTKVEIIARMKEDLFYDLPQELIGKLWQGKYRGQRQSWFLARLIGDDSDIDLEAHDPPEFCEWQWIEPERLPEMIVPFKASVYRAVLNEFRDLI